MKDTTGKRWVTYPDSYYINEVLKESFKNQMADLPVVFETIRLQHNYINLVTQLSVIRRYQIHLSRPMKKKLS